MYYTKIYKFIYNQNEKLETIIGWLVLPFTTTIQLSVLMDFTVLKFLTVLTSSLIINLFFLYWLSFFIAFNSNKYFFKYIWYGYIVILPSNIVDLYTILDKDRFDLIKEYPLDDSGKYKFVNVVFVKNIRDVSLIKLSLTFDQ